jgi:hypothetical protein
MKGLFRRFHIVGHDSGGVHLSFLAVANWRSVVFTDTCGIAAFKCGRQLEKPLEVARWRQTERELRDERLRIATYNINNVNKRLSNLLAWLRPDCARRRLPAGTQGGARRISGA